MPLRSLWRHCNESVNTDIKTEPKCIEDSLGNLVIYVKLISTNPSLNFNDGLTILGLTSLHYIDIIMTTMASQITSLTVVCSTVYSDADQRKHQSSVSLAFVRGIHWDRWIPCTKGKLRGKCFHLMTSSWKIQWQLETDTLCVLSIGESMSS